MKRLIIIGAGNSIRPELHNGLWDKLRKEYTFGLNDVIYFYKPTVPVCVDWYWYRERYDAIKNYSLIIGKHDPKFYATHPEIKVPRICDNTVFLKPSNNYYHGKESWNKGFYSGVLCGCFALTIGIALGFKEIYLLGYDFTETYGKTHFYEEDELKDQVIGYIKEKDGSVRCGIGKNGKGQYRTGIFNDEPSKFFNVYKKSFVDRVLNTGVKIYNVSPESKIQVFSKISYKKFYSKLASQKIDIDQEEGTLQIRQIITNELGGKN